MAYLLADIFLVRVFEDDLPREAGALAKWVAFRSTDEVPAR